MRLDRGTEWIPFFMIIFCSNLISTKGVKKPVCLKGILVMSFLPDPSASYALA